MEFTESNKFRSFKSQSKGWPVTTREKEWEPDMMFPYYELEMISEQKDW